MTTDPLVIRLTAGIGSGRTELSAFDGALHAAGVANFNLIRLSSVIPPGSTVEAVDAAAQLKGEHGDALYCVYAAAYAVLPGHEAWAGIAWSLRDDGSRAGLFVEHEGPSQEQVDHDLTVSLEDLNTTRGGGYTEGGRLLTSIRCDASPVCAVVVASYQRAGWGPRA